jgi:hypothetical protein
MKTETVQIIAIIEGMALAVCIGLLLRAYWRIRRKNFVLRNYIRREQEQILLKIEQENIEKENNKLNNNQFHNGTQN